MPIMANERMWQKPLTTCGLAKQTSQLAYQPGDPLLPALWGCLSTHGVKLRVLRELCTEFRDLHDGLCDGLSVRIGVPGEPEDVAEPEADTLGPEPGLLSDIVSAFMHRRGKGLQRLELILEPLAQGPPHEQEEAHEPQQGPGQEQQDQRARLTVREQQILAVLSAVRLGAAPADDAPRELYLQGQLAITPAVAAAVLALRPSALVLREYGDLPPSDEAVESYRAGTTGLLREWLVYGRELELQDVSCLATLPDLSDLYHGGEEGRCRHLSVLRIDYLGVALDGGGRGRLLPKEVASFMGALPGLGGRLVDLKLHTHGRCQRPSEAASMTKALHAMSSLTGLTSLDFDVSQLYQADLDRDLLADREGMHQADRAWRGTWAEWRQAMTAALRRMPRLVQLRLEGFNLDARALAGFMALRTCHVGGLLLPWGVVDAVQREAAVQLDAAAVRELGGGGGARRVAMPLPAAPRVTLPPELRRLSCSALSPTVVAALAPLPEGCCLTPAWLDGECGLSITPFELERRRPRARAAGTAAAGATEQALAYEEIDMDFLTFGDGTEDEEEDLAAAAAAAAAEDAAEEEDAAAADPQGAMDMAAGALNEGAPGGELAGGPAGPPLAAAGAGAEAAAAGAPQGPQPGAAAGGAGAGAPHAAAQQLQPVAPVQAAGGDAAAGAAAFGGPGEQGVADDEQPDGEDEESGTADESDGEDEEVDEGPGPQLGRGAALQVSPRCHYYLEGSRRLVAGGPESAHAKAEAVEAVASSAANTSGADGSGSAAAAAAAAAGAGAGTAAANAAGTAGVPQPVAGGAQLAAAAGAAAGQHDAAQRHAMALVLTMPHLETLDISTCMTASTSLLPLAVLPALRRLAVRIGIGGYYADRFTMYMYIGALMETAVMSSSLQELVLAADSPELYEGLAAWMEQKLESVGRRVQVQRNFTLSSLASQQDSFPTIALSAQGKVKLGHGVRLFFTRVVVEVSVLDMLQRGLGFLVPSDAGSGANFALQDVGAVVGVPVDGLSSANAWWAILINRAAGYPGAQLARMAEPAPVGCSRDPTAPAFKRCWTMHATVDDGVLDVMQQQQPQVGSLEPEYVPKHFTLHFLGVDLMYGSPTERAGASGIAFSAGISMNVTSGHQLAQAFADPGVTTIVVMASVLNINNEDFDGLSVPVPVRVDRNVTVTAPEGQWPVLLLNAVRKVVMGQSVTVLLQGVVAKPLFTESMLRYPHVLLFAPSSPRSHARLLLQDAALWLDYGFAGPYGLVWLTSLPRPSDSPGLQAINADLVHSPDTCVNDASAPPRKRCWAGSGTFADVMVSAVDIDRYTALTYPLYYTTCMYNTQYFFSKVLSGECLKQIDPIGCYVMEQAAARSAAAGSSPPSPAPFPPPSVAPALQQAAGASSSGSSSHGGGGSGSSGSLPIIIGAVVGGVGLMFLIASAAFFWAGARRRRWQEQAAASLSPVDHNAKCATTGDSRRWSNGLAMFLSSATTSAATTPPTPTTAGATPTQPSSRITTREGAGVPGGPSAATSSTGMLDPTPGVIAVMTPCFTAARPSTLGASSSAGAREVASGGNATSAVVASDMSSNLRPGISPVGGQMPERSGATAAGSPASTAAAPAAAASANARAAPLVVQRESDAVVHSTPFRPDLDVGVQIRNDAGTTAELDNAPWGGSHATPYDSIGTDSLTATVPVFAVLGSGAAGSSAAAVDGMGRDGGAGRGVQPGAEASAAAAGAAAQTGAADGAAAPGKSPASSASSTVVQLLPTVLGKGAFGRVVEGRYQGQPVAVKLLLGLMDSTAGNKDELMLSFVQEVEVLGRCEHPNVVKLMAACMLPPQLALVMERMEGSLERLVFGAQRSAAAVAAAGGSQSLPLPPPPPSAQHLLPLPKVLHIAIQMAQGISYLHPTIVHRDLKPANVLINGGESDFPIVKLSDFGLARMRVCTLPTQTPEAGTPAYMAPELFDVTNNIVSHRADMYSFAVVLWVMLTGQQPWKDWNLVAIAYNVSRGIRLSLDSLDPQRCPPKLKRLITACWETDPLRRPAAAEALKELLLIQEQVAMGIASPRTDQVPAAGPAPTEPTLTVGAGEAA
ncbi:hypothetical protein HYH02_010801 [Chlamydomonas schloesseri]|uniref:Protein kinase domain-containing protein n=1 Tax=Chlamydomonas schloesseri TaxID=2026947 RepID=A0A835W5R3_9CHLO|nr:hypothetical protein HYH02_010801 [Chlamydomonas schloesseri]|eukprot:KAG2438343.1 hypothetical protein HYH02_010801 [Chlamydomonas schloesseri]